MKICLICKEAKDISDFYRHENTKDFLRSECKKCWNKLSLDYYFKNKAAIVEKRKRYYFKRKYNLSEEELNEFKRKQNGLCAICKRKASLVVDHNHSTNKIRGLLCNYCNLNVAYLENNPGWADKAIAYLEKYNG